jgi:hypothetical protein
MCNSCLYSTMCNRLYVLYRGRTMGPNVDVSSGIIYADVDVCGVLYRLESSVKVKSDVSRNRYFISAIYLLLDSYVPVFA